MPRTLPRPRRPFGCPQSGSRLGQPPASPDFDALRGESVEPTNECTASSSAGAGTRTHGTSPRGFYVRGPAPPKKTTWAGPRTNTGTLADPQPECAETVAEPTPTAVTSPVGETEAIQPSDEFHSTGEPLITAPFWSNTVTVSCQDSPGSDRNTVSAEIDREEAYRGSVPPPPQAPTANKIPQRGSRRCLIACAWKGAMRAGGGTRTHTGLLPGVFKTPASTDFATPARARLGPSYTMSAEPGDGLARFLQELPDGGVPPP